MAPHRAAASRTSLAVLAVAVLTVTAVPAAHAVEHAAPSSVTTTTTTATATATATTTVTAAPYVLPARLRGINLERVPTRSKVVALTFDGGGDSAGASRILSTLAAQGVPATFFLTGRWARLYPALARRIAARYPVANHTESHPDLTRLSAAGVRRQVITASRSIGAVIGRRPVHLFRFPYGAYRTSTIRTVNELNSACIGWTVDTLGWMGTSGGISARRIVTRVVDALVPGQIVLMHLGSNPQDRSALDAEALPGIIRALRARGYRFATLPSLLRVPAR